MNKKISIVIGASRGIGFAICEALLKKDKHVIAACRDLDHGDNINQLNEQGADLMQLDITDDNSIESFTKDLLSQEIEVTELINCVGILHDQSMQPEKQLSKVTRENLLKALDTNAVGHVMLVKALEPLLKKSSEAKCVSISARVGSIEDNGFGGWYAYRASKAALNMYLKNIAIEFERKYKNKIIIASLHPGTTDTDLSAPFQSRMGYKLHSAQETAHNLLGVINNLSPSKSGAFLDFQGKSIPW